MPARHLPPPADTPQEASPRKRKGAGRKPGPSIDIAGEAGPHRMTKKGAGQGSGGAGRHEPGPDGPPANAATGVMPRAAGPSRSTQAGSGDKPLTMPPPPRRGRGSRLHPDGRPVDRRPFFAREENQASWNAALYLSDFIGLHLICPRAGCQREGRCLAQDKRDWPLCNKLYRGTLNFVLNLAQAAYGEDLSGREPSPEPGAEPAPGPEPAPRPGPAPGSASRTKPGGRRVVPPGTSILAKMAADGAPIEQMARPADAGFDPWRWSQDPELVQMMAEMKARAPSRGGGRT